MAVKRDKRAATFRTVVIFVIIFIVGSFALVRLSERNGSSDLRNTLAQCLTEKGAVMYGAYWCPNCANQKKDFGSAWKYVKDVECAIPGNPRAQTQECKDKGITGYPTWVFADDSRLVGRQPLEALADQAGCPWGDGAERGEVVLPPETSDAGQGAETLEEGTETTEEAPVDNGSAL